MAKSNVLKESSSDSAERCSFPVWGSVFDSDLATGGRNSFPRGDLVIVFSMWVLVAHAACSVLIEDELVPDSWGAGLNHFLVVLPHQPVEHGVPPIYAS